MSAICSKHACRQHLSAMFWPWPQAQTLELQQMLLSRYSSIWWFPKIGVPPVIIHFTRIFPSKNHPAIGVPPLMETSIFVPVLSHIPAMSSCWVSRSSRRTWSDISPGRSTARPCGVSGDVSEVYEVYCEENSRREWRNGMITDDYYEPTWTNCEYYDYDDDNFYILLWCLNWVWFSWWSFRSCSNQGRHFGNQACGHASGAATGTRMRAASGVRPGERHRSCEISAAAWWRSGDYPAWWTWSQFAKMAIEIFDWPSKSSFVVAWWF